MSFQMEDLLHPDATIKTSYIQIYPNRIEKNAILLTRLTKLLIEKELDYVNCKQVVGKYVEKIQYTIAIIVSYIKMLEKETRTNEEELKQAMEKKELIETRNKIGDISGEEYRLKLAVINWDINDLIKKQTHENSIEIENLSLQMQSENLNEIREVIKNAEIALTNTEYSPETYETISYNIEILKRTVP